MKCSFKLNLNDIFIIVTNEIFLKKIMVVTSVGCKWDGLKPASACT